MPRAGNKWDQRIDRARELAKAYPFSAEILTFYSTLAAFQKASYVQLQSSCSFANGRQSSLPTALDEVDLGLLMTRFNPFVSMIAREAPALLAEFARVLATSGAAAWAALLRQFWPGNPPAATETWGDVPAPLAASRSTPEERANSKLTPSPTEERPQHTRRRDQNPLERFGLQAFLQPYAEFLADRAEVQAPPVRRPTCPYCGLPPLVGVLRQEGDGAKRLLVCSFCRTEWDYMRIFCPACEESSEKNLRLYTAEAFPHVRVEACDTCRAYIKTIDLTRNGLAVPEVDDLATLPLTLWADENGYKKVIRNIMGL